MGNPAIYDGKKLFSAEHRNLLKTGSGITKAAVQSMILTLSTQKDEFGQPIIIRPGAFIVPVGMSFDVYTLFNSPTINTEGNTQSVNPLYQYRNLDVIEDPTINTLAGGFGNVMPWFMTANTTDTAFIESIRLAEHAAAWRPPVSWASSGISTSTGASTSWITVARSRTPAPTSQTRWAKRKERMSYGKS